VEYRILGKTGLKISRLGFGGIPIQKIDAEGTKKLIGKLIEEGVNFIDTARGYTVSEQYLGFALEGVRDRFVLATKSMARTKEAMAKDIDISLKNLRTEYIDLYQIHNPNAKDLDAVMAEDGALSALLEAKAGGVGKDDRFARGRRHGGNTEQDRPKVGAIGYVYCGSTF
jgi:aryl-alcohol dehydrogenase-like predicted oxidoreductase